MEPYPSGNCLNGRRFLPAGENLDVSFNPDSTAFGDRSDQVLWSSAGAWHDNRYRPGFILKNKLIEFVAKATFGIAEGADQLNLRSDSLQNDGM